MPDHHFNPVLAQAGGGDNMTNANWIRYVAAEGLEIGAPFDELWDRTIKKADRALYGWAANPWVWVIEFGRINAEDVKKWHSAKL